MDSVGVKYGCEISSLLNVKIYTRILNQNFENLLLLAPRETTTDQEPKNAGIAAPAAMPSAEMEPTGKKKTRFSLHTKFYGISLRLESSDLNQKINKYICSHQFKLIFLEMYSMSMYSISGCEALMNLFISLSADSPVMITVCYNIVEITEKESDNNDIYILGQKFSAPF